MRRSCSACGQEVRWGWRNEGQGLRQGWWHREHVDHRATFGQVADLKTVYTPVLERRREKNPDWAGWTDVDEDGAKIEPEPEPFDRRDDLGIEQVKDQQEGWDAIPEPEVRATGIHPDDPRTPGGARKICNLLKKSGWERRRLSFARGPYLGAKGDLLSISDHVVLVARVTNSEERRYVVASWRDGKFDSAWIHSKDPNGKQTVLDKVNSNQLKEWIRNA